VKTPGDVCHWATAAGAEDFLARHLEFMAETFLVQGEFQPMAAVLAKRDPKTRMTMAKPALIPVLSALMKSENDKDALAEAVVQMAARTEAFGVIMMTEAWMLRPGVEQKIDEWIGHIAEHPDSVEVLVLSYQHKHLGQGIAIADILREGGLRLGPWRIHREGEQGLKASGRFADLMPRGRD
jgi:hypothetical protein